MSQSGEYRYYENAKFQAVSLPYGKDGRLRSWREKLLLRASAHPELKFGLIVKVECGELFMVHSSLFIDKTININNEP